MCVRVYVSVCLSVRGRMPTLLHGLGCNLGSVTGYPLVVQYWVICNRCTGCVAVATLWKCVAEPSGKTTLAGDKIDAPATCAVPFRPYCGGIVTRTRNVSEYMLVLALCLVNQLSATAGRLTNRKVRYTYTTRVSSRSVKSGVDRRP